jgi:hypothetical protein
MTRQLDALLNAATPFAIEAASVRWVDTLVAMDAAYWTG